MKLAFAKLALPLGQLRPRLDRLATYGEVLRIHCISNALRSTRRHRYLQCLGVLT